MKASIAKKTYNMVFLNHAAVLVSLGLIIVLLIEPITSQLFTDDEVLTQLLMRATCFIIYVIVAWYGLVTPIEREKSIMAVNRYLNSI